MTPFRGKDGRLIVDERCACGHLKSRHGHRLADLPDDRLIGVPQHGGCLEECDCQRFTFRGYLYEGDPA
jgi:hypothetical protein